MTNEEIMRKAQSILYDPDRAGSFSHEDIGILSAAIGIGRIAIREQQERDDLKPLTLAELRQMDGDPVWLAVEGGIWGIVHSKDSLVSLSRGDIVGLHAMVGKAYRHKPKEASR